MESIGLNLSQHILQLLILAVPAIGAGTLHMMVVKWNIFSFLKIPLDGGKEWRGKRLFGDHKTLRGVILMIAFSICFCFLLRLIVDIYPGWKHYNLLEFHRYSPVFYGVLYGVGYTLSELPNSFIKRRLDIDPGSRGKLYNILLDNFDSTLGCFLFLYPFIEIQFYVIVIGVFFLSLVHMLVNVLLYALSLREQPL